MAGYKSSGEEFVNATSINTQIEKQRDAISVRQNDPNRNYLGTSKDNLYTYFSHPDFDNVDDMRQGIFDASYDAFTALDSSAFNTREDFNPDFPGGAKLDSSSRGAIYSNIVRQADKPNTFGPNIAAPNLDALIEGSIVPGSNIPQGRDNLKNRGFGWQDDRNKLGKDAATIGKYFSRHYSNNSGEVQENISSPVFGEAKSPEDDTIIRYDQPD